MFSVVDDNPNNPTYPVIEFEGEEWDIEWPGEEREVVDVLTLDGYVPIRLGKEGCMVNPDTGSGGLAFPISVEHRLRGSHEVTILRCIQDYPDWYRKEVLQ